MNKILTENAGASWLAIIAFIIYLVFIFYVVAL